LRLKVEDEMDGMGVWLMIDDSGDVREDTKEADPAPVVLWLE